MEFISLTDWIGYLAMAVLLMSFLMKNMKTLRLVNSVGGLLFIVYGCMLEPISIPVIVTNAAIVCIHLYFLFFKQNEVEN